MIALVVTVENRKTVATVDHWMGGKRTKDAIGNIPPGASVTQVITISMRSDIMLREKVITAEILGRAGFWEGSRACRSMRWSVVSFAETRATRRGRHDDPGAIVMIGTIQSCTN